jgi:hypothetical protein
MAIGRDAVGALIATALAASRRPLSSVAPKAIQLATALYRQAIGTPA